MPGWQTVVATLVVTWGLAYSLRALWPNRWRRALANAWWRWRGDARRSTATLAAGSGCAACDGCASAERATQAAPRGSAPSITTIATIAPPRTRRPPPGVKAR